MQSLYTRTTKSTILDPWDYPYSATKKQARRLARRGQEIRGFLRLERAEEDEPGENRFRDEREDDVAAFAEQIVLELPDALVLQEHVDGERVEGDEIGRKDRPDESGNRVEVRIDADVERDREPRRKADDGTEDEGQPVDLLTDLDVAGIQEFHVEAEQVHRGVRTWERPAIRTRRFGLWE